MPAPFRSALPPDETALLYRLMAERSASYALLLLDAEGQVMTWNIGAEAMKGYRAEEALGRFFGFLYTEEDQRVGRAERNLQQALQQGQFREEGWRRRRDGSLFWAHVEITALRDEGGRLRGFSKATLDLTARKQLEERLQRQQHETRQILAAADAGTWVWDARRRRVDVSPDFLRLLGFDANCIGERLANWMHLIHPDDRKQLHAAAARSLTRLPHQPLATELRVRTAGGEYRWFYTRADWQRDAQGGAEMLLGVSVDAHQRHLLQDDRERLIERLEAEQRQFRAILDQLPSGVMVAAMPSGELVYQNAEAAALLGKAPVKEAEALVRAVRAGDVIKSREVVYEHAGGTATLAVSAAPVRDSDEAPRLAVAVFHDVQPLKDIQASLAGEKERAQITLKVLTDGVIIVDPHGRIDYLNPAAEQLTGRMLESARGAALSQVLDFQAQNDSEGESACGLVARCLADGSTPALFQQGTLRAAGGRTFAVEAAMAPIHLADGTMLGAVMVLHDVTESRRLLHSLAHQASHDALTGLANRREFETRLKRSIERAKRDGSASALLVLDLDQFKIVNDTSGHAAGDELLRQLAQVYRGMVRERDTFARIGGDEFALILEHCRLEEALQVANKVLDATASFRFQYAGRSFRIGASIGLVPVNAAAVSLEQTLRLADHACYMAKEHGRNRIVVHQENDADLARRQSDMHWVGRLNEALRQDQLELFYQPIAPVGGPPGRLHYEILLRLKDGSGRHIGPGAFLPAAERFDLMPAVDRWVLRKVLEWLERQPAHVERLDMCTINLSRRTLADASFQQYAIQCLENSPVPPHKLCFEITENGVIDNPNRTIGFIESLKRRGCRFSLDDFGTGMTSFSYLKMLPVDFIKIDGSFVTMMKESAVDLEMVRFTNEISHIMGRQTIAEYVGDEATLQNLRELNIDYAQGYWIGAPKPLEGMAA